MSFRGSTQPLRANYDALLGFGRDALGFDPMIFVNIGLIFGAVAAFIHYVGRTMYRWATRTCLSSIHINDDDKIFHDVMRWMADFELGSKRFRSVKATTGNENSWDDEDAATNRPLRPDRLLSYRALVNRIPIKLAPFEAGHLFRFQGHWLYFSHRLHRASQLDVLVGSREKAYLQITCAGRSLAPLRALLDTAQAHALSLSRAATTIHRALPQRGDRLSWSQVAQRPARDIRTVILPQRTKADLLADVNEYLHPRTRRWYADHGVPYRRGYLFSGAPGIGKTSLTAAMAGVFGLDIYVVSLLDTALTEAILMKLLADLPTRCIVLLEDVDAAGLQNRGVAAISSAANPATASSRIGGVNQGPSLPQPDDKDPTKALAALAGSKHPTTGVSLSGLLNAIDGVSSAEGRILVLTTNAEAALDPALVRPGRIDMHVAFELPKAAEARELFVSMYRDTEDGSSEAGDEVTASNEATDMSSKANGVPKTRVANMANGSAAESKNSLQEKKFCSQESTDAAEEGHLLADLNFHPSDRLAALADRFAAAVPEGILSLAAMQGFLLRHKRDPEVAVAEAPDWARETIERLKAADEREKQKAEEAGERE